jgi:hypothetical protein
MVGMIPRNGGIGNGMIQHVSVAAAPAIPRKSTGVKQSKCEFTHNGSGVLKVPRRDAQDEMPVYRIVSFSALRSSLVTRHSFSALRRSFSTP